MLLARCLPLVVLFALVAAARAELPKTPYEAVVVWDEVLVRSGPGKQMYYPTGKLKRGDRVTVRRHDPGGWFVIDPPPGSFSWIATEFVRRTEGNRGVVTANNFVRIGSELGEVSEAIRHMVVAGEQVEILGERTLQTERGPVRMYKIKPPRGENRWIPGAAVVPASKYRELAQARPKPSPRAAPLPSDTPRGKASNPPQAKKTVQSGQLAKSRQDTAFAKRSEVSKPSGRRPSPSPSPQRRSRDEKLLERPLVRITKDGSHKEPTAEQIAKEKQKQRLEKLDDRFRTIIKQKISEWDFTQLQRDYVQLKKEVKDPLLAYQLQLRLEAVERYQKKKREYDEFVRLTAETSRRDAQLLALQRKALSPTGETPPNGGDQPRSPSRWQRPRPTPATQKPRSRSPRLDGAGIIQRSALTFPGAPRYVLLAPNGRILAYLQPAPNVQLEPYVGRAMGLVGRRYYRPDLQTDFMIVEKLIPVRLKP
ncbi:MAG: hypothetical protein GXP27_00335 [Planctomycetes bacterium]|nr:hypothetical protein [Planctomycetota bacterium]